MTISRVSTWYCNRLMAWRTSLEEFNLSVIAWVVYRRVSTLCFELDRKILAWKVKVVRPYDIASYWVYKYIKKAWFTHDILYVLRLCDVNYSDINYTKRWNKIVHENRWSCMLQKIHLSIKLVLEYRGKSIQNMYYLWFDIISVTTNITTGTAAIS